MAGMPPCMGEWCEQMAVSGSFIGKSQLPAVKSPTLLNGRLEFEPILGLAQTRRNLGRGHCDLL